MNGERYSRTWLHLLTEPVDPANIGKAQMDEAIDVTSALCDLDWTDPPVVTFFGDSGVEGYIHNDAQVTLALIHRAGVDQIAHVLGQDAADGDDEDFYEVVRGSVRLGHYRATGSVPLFVVEIVDAERFPQPLNDWMLEDYRGLAVEYVEMMESASDDYDAKTAAQPEG